MTPPAAIRAVKALVHQSRELTRAGRYGPALAAAVRAVDAAERLDNPALLVQALVEEAIALRMSGERGAALARLTRVLAIAANTTGPDWSDSDVTRVLARAYMHWVGVAVQTDGMRVRELFAVLDAGEQYLRSIGRPSWRSGMLLQRAQVHSWLGEDDAAVATAREALAAYQPGAPGYSLHTHRLYLGDYLRHVGRAAAAAEPLYQEAEQLYQAILDQPDNTPVVRYLALYGLAWCALDCGDVPAGQRYATAGVREAEPLGGDALSAALEPLIEACRAAGDLATAQAVAARKLEVARRLGGHRELYYALVWVVAVAWDRGELDTVAELLPELDEHATAVDADTGTGTYTETVARYRRRLADLPDDQIRADDFPAAADPRPILRCIRDTRHTPGNGNHLRHGK